MTPPETGPATWCPHCGKQNGQHAFGCSYETFQAPALSPPVPSPSGEPRMPAPPPTPPRTWNGQPSAYWQHNDPLKCPRGHVMGWLGSAFWLCSRCVYANGATSGTRTGGTIYVQTKETADASA